MVGGPLGCHDDFFFSDTQSKKRVERILDLEESVGEFLYRFLRLTSVIPTVRDLDPPEKELEPLASPSIFLAQV